MSSDPNQVSGGEQTGEDSRAGKRAGDSLLSTIQEMQSRFDALREAHEQSERRERELAESKRQARKAWISPVIMTIVGLSISTGIVALAGGGPEVLAHLMNFGLTLVIAGVVYFVCSLLWIGFDEPLPMTALRLMGAVALGDIAFTLVGLSPFRPIYIWIIPTIIYCVILAQVMEVDYEDAVIVAVVTGVLKVFAVLYLMHLMGMLRPRACDPGVEHLPRATLDADQVAAADTALRCVITRRITS